MSATNRTELGAAQAARWQASVPPETRRRIVELNAMGKSAQRIAEELTDERVPPVGQAGAWGAHTVTLILKNWRAT